ncbi:collagenolytic protease [Clostridium taeniosporum]|uniref:Cell wall-binding protein n=1 Tax=Clostridium taeniosporum TaxID=394958 RepID=A0A1D7XMY2_9CLOT|nr:collagenolytic protease [Clostridium taeniosporum]AOR24540.1 hypothetical protein BGI42_12680 [Clostridium taeniosporum]
MVKRIIKKSLLVLMTVCCLNILGFQSGLKVYATTLEDTKLTTNENKLDGEKFIKVCEEENLYKASVYNNIGRGIINFRFLDNIKLNNIKIDILNPNNDKKSANYVLDSKNSVILIDNLQAGLTKVIIKEKITEKEICKLYIDYNKNFNDNDEVGWVKSLGQWYFIDPSTRDRKTNWLLHNGHWYYLDEDGVMKNGWILYNDNWYYLNSKGVMQTGFIKDEKGDLYYLNEDGTLRV